MTGLSSERQRMNVQVTAVVMAVAGLLVYALSSNPKAGEAGRIVFFCGVLAAALSLK